MATAEAKNFSEEVLAVFVPTLVLFTIVFEIIMGPFVVALISGYHGEKLALATFLTRITFPYLILISLVSLFSGILNSARASSPRRPSRPRCSTWRCCRALIFVPVGGHDDGYRTGDRGHARRSAAARRC